MATLLDIRKWDRLLDRTRSNMDKKANDVVRTRVKKVYLDAVKVSPQWSGNYAINWGIETNQVKPATQMALKKTPWTTLAWWDNNAGDALSKPTGPAPGKDKSKPWAEHRGAPAALALAKKGDTLEQIAQLKWNNKIKLVNMSPIADQLDSGTLHLRNVNLIQGHVGVVSYLKAKYSFLK